MQKHLVFLSQGGRDFRTKLARVATAMVLAASEEVTFDEIELDEEKLCELTIVIYGVDLSEALRQAKRIKNLAEKLDISATMIATGPGVGRVTAMEHAWGLIEPMYGDRVVFLCDETGINGDFITPLIEALDSGAALAGPGACTIFETGHWGKGKTNATVIEGWCFAVEPEWIDASGGITDEELAPSCFEDMDLSLRVQEAGGPLAVVDAPVERPDWGTDPQGRYSFDMSRDYLRRKWGLDAPECN